MTTDYLSLSYLTTSGQASLNKPSRILGVSKETLFSAVKSVDKPFIQVDEDGFASKVSCGKEALTNKVIVPQSLLEELIGVNIYQGRLVSLGDSEVGVLYFNAMRFLNKESSPHKHNSVRAILRFIKQYRLLGSSNQISVDRSSSPVAVEATVKNTIKRLSVEMGASPFYLGVDVNGNQSVHLAKQLFSLQLDFTSENEQFIYEFAKRHDAFATIFARNGVAGGDYKVVFSSESKESLLSLLASYSEEPESFYAGVGEETPVAV